MKYISNTLDFKIEEPAVVSLGKFDGLHAGHRYLLEAMDKWKAEGLKSVIFTFDIPPRSLEKDRYQVLSTNEEKLHIFESAGVDYLVECPFTEEFRQQSPRDFLEWLCGVINVKSIVCGTDFCFGYQRQGNYKTLLKYGEILGYQVSIVTKKQHDGEDISSTRIRDAILKGEIEEANLLLGYPYFAEGEVIHGRELGRTIGIPTINQVPPATKILPPDGVYAVKVQLGDSILNGISNVGFKPTIEGQRPRGIETHILDYEGDLYGKNVKVFFYHYVRPEQRFDSVEMLAAQMQKDVAAIREYFRIQ